MFGIRSITALVMKGAILVTDHSGNQWVCTGRSSRDANFPFLYGICHELSDAELEFDQNGVSKCGRVRLHFERV